MADQRIISMAPNRRVALIEKRDDNGEREYNFVRTSDNKQLGCLNYNEVSNVAIVASWSPSSTNVALLVYYGTKLSGLDVYHQGKDGMFEPVILLPPDPIELYRKRTGKTLPQPGDGHSANGVGPWLDENTVSLISGDAKQTEDLDEYLHILVTFRARIIGNRAEVSHLDLIGPLTNARFESFLKKWGKQYVETHD